MKLNSLEKIRDVLLQPRPDQVVHVDSEIAAKALRSIERMFELTTG